MGGFESRTLPREVTFSHAEIAPPSQLYINNDDTLVCRTFVRTLSNTAIVINARILRPNGEIIPQRFVHRITSTIVADFSTFPLAEGFLLSAIASIEGVVAQRGELYVMLTIARGVLATPEFFILARGYLTRDEAVGWPGGLYEPGFGGRGFITSFTGADPAAGVEASVSFNATALWRLIGATATLVTAAAVANRRANLALQNSVAGPLILYCANAVQVASTTVIYTWGAGCGLFSDFVNAPFRATIPTPVDAIFRGAGPLTSTDNLNAADDWSALTVYVEQWLSE